MNPSAGLAAGPALVAGPLLGHNAAVQALVWNGPRQLAVETYPTPELATGEVLIRVSHAGICGSELEGYLGTSGIRTPPLVMGHEFAGTVELIDDTAAAAAAAAGIAHGTRVTVNPLSACGACPLCREGLRQLCAKRQLIGAHRPGAFAELVSAPLDDVLPVADTVSPQAAAMTEPTAVAERIAELAAPNGQPVLVVGAGPIGLLAIQTLRLAGAGTIIAADTNAERLAIAAALGAVPVDPVAEDVAAAARAATDGAGVPVAVDAVGRSVTRAACMAAVRATGRVIISGLHDEQLEVSAADLIRCEITLRGAYAFTAANFEAALTHIASGAITLQPWSREEPLANGPACFEELLSGNTGAAKILLTP